MSGSMHVGKHACREACIHKEADADRGYVECFARGQVFGSHCRDCSSPQLHRDLCLQGGKRMRCFISTGREVPMHFIVRCPDRGATGGEGTCAPKETLQ